MTKKKSLTGQKTVTQLKQESVDMLILISERLKSSIKTAQEHNGKLRDGINILYAERTTETSKDCYCLKQAAQWMDLMLGGAMEDINYIASHLRAIEAIIQLEATIKKEIKEQQDEIINKTF